MISIIDYRAGNTASVSNALKRLGADYQITSDIQKLEASSGIIFPGVGHAQAAMQALKPTGLDVWLRETPLPVLGICLGMQLLFEHSVEGDTDCLRLFPGKLLRFDNREAKVPHMGWNTFGETFDAEHPLLEGIGQGDYFYYVHSYYAPLCAQTIGACSYAGVTFTSVAAEGNKMGVQFHPEKSGTAGARLLSNFINLTR